MHLFRTTLAVLIAAALLAGCGPKRPKVSMSEGHATIGASDAVYELAVFLASEFRGSNPNAFIDINRDTDRALIDSLANDRAEEIFLDRQLTPAETLAIRNRGFKLWTYPVAYYPVYLMAKSSNAVEGVDSTQLRGILRGTIQNWRELGGPNVPIHAYLPAPGDGGWVSLFSFFGGLDSLSARICSTSVLMLDSAKSDPGALIVWSKPREDLSGYKTLSLMRDSVRIRPSVATILEEGGYPFRLEITYITTHNKADVAAGYLTFAVGNLGQRRIMDALRYRPASVPVRMVKMRGGQTNPQ